MKGRWSWFQGVYGGDNSISRWHIITMWSLHWHKINVTVWKTCFCNFLVHMGNERVCIILTPKHWITIAIWSSHWNFWKWQKTWSEGSSAQRHLESIDWCLTGILSSSTPTPFNIQGPYITFCKWNDHIFWIIYTMQMHIYTTVITYSTLFCTRTNVNFTLWDGEKYPSRKFINMTAQIFLWHIVNTGWHKSSSYTLWMTFVPGSFLFQRHISLIRPIYLTFREISCKYWVHREQSVRPGAVTQTGWWIWNDREIQLS